MAGGSERIGPGPLVLVVGPSGAGKDTLIRLAVGSLAGNPRLRIARRIVTRPVDAASEDHDAVSEAVFADLVAAGGTALDWRAHGLGYALPIEIDRRLAEGAVVVANVSRKVLERAAAKYANVVVVHVTAPPDMLRARLLARGREHGAGIEERLASVPLAVPAQAEFHEIVNDSDPETGARRLARILETALHPASPCRGGWKPPAR